MIKVLIIIGALALCFTLASCAAPAGHTLSEGVPLIDPVATMVNTVTVVRGDVIERQPFFGMVRTASEPVVVNVTVGYEFEHLVGSGEKIYEGQAIAQMNMEHLEEILEELETRFSDMRRINALHNRRSELAIDLLRLDLNDALLRDGANRETSTETDRLSPTVEWAMFNLGVAQENQRMAELDLLSRINEIRDEIAAAVFYAPFGGIVTNVLFSPVNVLGETIILTVARDGQRTFVEFAGARGILMGLGVDHAARVTALYGDRQFELQYLPLTSAEEQRYGTLGRTLGAHSRTPLRFAIDAPDHELPPVGAYVTLYVYTANFTDVLRLPSQAITRGALGGASVIRVEPDGTHESVPVELYAFTDTFAAISSGVEEGDVIFVRE